MYHFREIDNSNIPIFVLKLSQREGVADDLLWHGNDQAEHFSVLKILNDGQGFQTDPTKV